MVPKYAPELPSYKHKPLGPTPEVSSLVGLGQEDPVLRICITDTVPVDTDTVALETALGEPLFYDRSASLSC